MLRTILEKEIKEILASTKFVSAFAICTALIIMSFYIGASNYQASLDKYEAARSENLRQFEGETEWFNVRQNRIMLPPNPLAALVAGVSNDVGRIVDVELSGELTAYGSRYNEEPIFAVFQFLDLEFIFKIVFSLFAILLGYDAISGEKESGTLKLALSNQIPISTFILGKLIGSASALTLSVFVSCLTQRTSSSFLILLVVWIVGVTILPRASVLIAGRAIDVPSVDEISAQKGAFASSLWSGFRDDLSGYKVEQTDDMEAMMKNFNSYMDSLSTNRDDKMAEFSGRLNEDRYNRQLLQQKVAFNLARVSPAASLSLATSYLAGTSLEIKNRFRDDTKSYQNIFSDFISEKTGMSMRGHIIIFSSTDDEEEKKAIDVREIPVFEPTKANMSDSVNRASVDMGLLAMFNLIFFAASFVAFGRYDAR